MCRAKGEQHACGLRFLFILAALVLVAGAIRAQAADCALPGMRPLHALTGAAPATVQVQGVVAAVFPGLRGFFLEAPASDWDGNPATPEAVFVYRRRHPLGLATGDAVALTGFLHRFHGLPEVEHPRLLARCGVAPLPPAVPVKLPLVRAGGWRALLGMRVSFAQPLVVSDLEDFGRYGEVAGTANTRRIAPTQITSPGPGAAMLLRRSVVRSVWLDDGSGKANSWPRELAGHRFDAARPLRAGQSLENLNGIAFHAFGRDLVEVTSFTLEQGTNPRLTVTALGLPVGLRILTFNVENYFNRAFSGPAFPAGRGARTAAEFACQQSKLVAVLAALHPALAGLEEIENNGYGPHGALAGLVAALNRAVPGAPYSYVHPPTFRLGSDLIAPALIYDAKVFVPVGKPAVLERGPTPAASVGLARPVLAASFRERSNGRTLTAAVVHLRSKRSACGGRFDNYSGAGYCALARVAASALVSRWLAHDPTGAGASAKFLLGDFNAYPHEAAIRTLAAAAWQDQLARFRPDAARRYTESFHDGAGTLDYVFANVGAAARVIGAAVWHVDADEAPEFGYAGHSLCRGPGAPYRASDHDPVVVVMKP